MRSIVCAVLPLTLLGCSGDDVALVIPPIDTEFVMFGTAPAGRSLSPPSIAVALTAELRSLEPETIAGTDIDMVFAGLSQADLPSQLSPDELVFVRSNDDLARPLPMLHEPHVLDVPSPSDNPTPLVPIDGPDVATSRADERDARFRTMLSDVALQSPCRTPTTPFLVTTPRLPADLVASMRDMSDGTTMVSFTTTSTLMVGIVPAGAQTLEIRPVPTGTVALVAGENATIRSLGNREVDLFGEKWPREFIVNFTGSGLGGVGAMYHFDDARRIYVERTPLPADAYPRVLYGLQYVTLDGVSQLCTYGGVQGADRRAAIWCRADGTSEWIATDFGRSFGITTIVTPLNATPIATDLAGSVWEYDPRGWRPVFESSVNANCDPLCASFGATWASPGGQLLAVLGGTKAQLLFVDKTSNDVQVRSPGRIDDALFAEERFGNDTALRFTGIAVDATGTIWAGTTRPELFRIASGSDGLERICLPPEMEGSPITSVHAHADGRLLIGMSPALFTYGDWR